MRKADCCATQCKMYGGVGWCNGYQHGKLNREESLIFSLRLFIASNFEKGHFSNFGKGHLDSKNYLDN